MPLQKPTDILSRTMILTAFSLVCSSLALAEGAADLIGTVREIDGRTARVLVEASGADVSGPIWLSRDAETRLTHGTPEAADPDGEATLSVGARVAIWLEGGVMESTPMQAHAREIRILADDDDDDDDARDQAPPAWVRPAGLDAVLDDAVRRGWLDEAGAGQLRELREFYDFLGKGGIPQRAQADGELSWIAVPSLRPQIIPTSRTLTEVLDAAFRARGESEFVYIRNLGTGDEPGLYYPPRQDDAPEPSPSEIPISLLDAREEAGETRAVVSTGSSISLLDYRALDGLELQVEGLLEADFLGEPTVFLLVRGVEVIVIAESASGPTAVKADALFLVHDRSLLGATHLSALAVTVSFNGKTGKLRLHK